MSSIGLKKDMSLSHNQLFQDFDDEDSLLDTESDVKPVFCRALGEIDGECGVKLAKCFTKSDSDQEWIPVIQIVLN